MGSGNIAIAQEVGGAEIDSFVIDAQDVRDGTVEERLKSVEGLKLEKAGDSLILEVQNESTQIQTNSGTYRKVMLEVDDGCSMVGVMLL